jgi:hypothetical protein
MVISHIGYWHFESTANTVMVGILSSVAVNRGFKCPLDQTNDYEIGICYFSTKI